VGRRGGLSRIRQILRVIAPGGSEVVKDLGRRTPRSSRSWRSFPWADGCSVLNDENRPIENNVFSNSRRQRFDLGL